jgi:hypothetical protein
VIAAMEDVPIGEIYGVLLQTAPAPRSTVPLRIVALTLRTFNISCSRRLQLSSAFLNVANRLLSDSADNAADISEWQATDALRPLRSVTLGQSPLSYRQRRRSLLPRYFVATLLSPCATRLAEPNALTGSVFVDEFDAG